VSSGRLLFSACLAALKSLWLVIGWCLGVVQLNGRRQLGHPLGPSTGVADPQGIKPTVSEFSV
jgi:hypothetical protein